MRHVRSFCLPLALADTYGIKANFSQCWDVEQVPAIEEESGLGHVVIDLLVIQILKHVPLGQHSNGMGLIDGFVRIAAD